MISVIANARNASYTSDDVITSGSIGIPCAFTLSSDFDGLSSIVVFKGSGVSIDVALPLSGRCVVPHEVLAQSGGYLQIGVYGRNGDGTIAIPTVWAGSKMILPGAVPSGVDPSEPTPDWTAQVQQMATEALENSKEALETASKAGDAAEAASTAASAAKTASETAVQAADTARSAAETATGAATSAQSAAQAAANAQSTAETASTAALAAKQAAETAMTAAEAAMQAAQAAAELAAQYAYRVYVDGTALVFEKASGRNGE